MSGLARQPLLHFLVIGAAVFALFAVLDDTPSATSSQEIAITEATTAGLAASFQAVWRRPPTPEELDGLIEDYIREEVLVREALALGLDRGDTIIRRRLRQKMEFLTDSAAGALAPSEDELRAYHAANSDRFSIGPQIAFQQVFLGESPSAADVAEARALLAAGAEPREVGTATLLPFDIPVSLRTAVDGAFGRGFFEAVVQLETGDWGGPVSSGYGTHLVRPTQRVNGITPPFDEVRDAVLRDWMRGRIEELSEAQYQQLRARYQIVQPEAAQASGD